MGKNKKPIKRKKSKVKLYKFDPMDYLNSEERIRGVVKAALKCGDAKEQEVVLQATEEARKKIKERDERLAAKGFTKFDAADYLENENEVQFFLGLAYGGGDKKRIRRAEETAQRARLRHKQGVKNESI